MEDRHPKRKPGGERRAKIAARAEAPQRTCIACRRKGEQASFWRIACDADGRAGLWSGIGRSAYVCRSVQCEEAALAKGRLDRAIRKRVSETERALLHQILSRGRVSKQGEF